MTDVTAGGAGRGVGLGIGELARLSGVSVRTIRFYCDEGIVTAGRSGGGHRRFDEGAVERLRLVRRLRALGMGLPAIRDVLDGRLSLTGAVAAERAALDAEWEALAWRRAALRAVEDADGPASRAARLDLLAAAPSGRAAHDALVAFWRRLAVPEVPEDMVEMFLVVGAPPPPRDPSPGQAVAYAELFTLVTDRSLERELPALDRSGRVRAREIALLEDVGEAWGMVLPLLPARQPAGPGPALDRFVRAHTTAWGRRDTAAFRRELLAAAHGGAVPYAVVGPAPRLRRYWTLVAEATGDTATLGAAHDWLLASLERSVGS
ncbi:MerR family transcriptional regulator [Streptomyces sp. 4N509B]|uniref:MerR family transcriptional regulator n=1 Tax=Streptomyces sp. 4N509B TaxID=3457413 RepID=UPI003FD3062A